MTIFDYIKHALRLDKEWLTLMQSIRNRGLTAPFEVLFYVEKKAPKHVQVVEKLLEEAPKPVIGMLLDYVGDVKLFNQAYSWLEELKRLVELYESGTIPEQEYRLRVDQLLVNMPLTVKSFLALFPWSVRPVVLKGLVRGIQVLDEVAGRLGISPVNLLVALKSFNIDELFHSTPHVKTLLNVLKNIFWGRLTSLVRIMRQSNIDVPGLVRDMLGGDVLDMLGRYVAGLTMFTLRDLYLK